MLTTIEANALAARGHSAQLVRALKRLGLKRCSERSVRYQYETSALRPSWYCLYWRWFHALWMVHRKGAEFLYEDFCARVAALRDGEPQHGERDWYGQLALCAKEQSEALQAAIRRQDDAAIRRELSESIAAERRLLQMLDRPAHNTSRRAA